MALTIASWNSTGIRNFFLRRLDFMFATVILLQETFVFSAQLPVLPGFQSFHLDPVATLGRPSGGLVTYVREGGPWVPELFDEIWVAGILWVRLVSKVAGVPSILLGVYLSRFLPAPFGFYFKFVFFSLLSV